MYAIFWESLTSNDGGRLTDYIYNSFKDANDVCRMGDRKTCNYDKTFYPRSDTWKE